mmetsp:Transcript_27210/g.81090  ORF Transcript_27210/g.81090 Transcript_27210/m.81090 type:complete len:342 (-) Transcript_27210:189-1214(-)
MRQAGIQDERLVQILLCLLQEALAQARPTADGAGLRVASKPERTAAGGLCGVPVALLLCLLRSAHERLDLPRLGLRRLLGRGRCSPVVGCLCGRWSPLRWRPGEASGLLRTLDGLPNWRWHLRRACRFIVGATRPLVRRDHAAAREFAAAGRSAAATLPTEESALALLELSMAFRPPLDGLELLEGELRRDGRLSLHALPAGTRFQRWQLRQSGRGLLQRLQDWHPGRRGLVGIKACLRPRPLRRRRQRWRRRQVDEQLAGAGPPDGDVDLWLLVACLSAGGAGPAQHISTALRGPCQERCSARACRRVRLRSRRGRRHGQVHEERARVGPPCGDPAALCS